MVLRSVSCRRGRSARSLLGLTTLVSCGIDFNLVLNTGRETEDSTAKHAKDSFTFGCLFHTRNLKTLAEIRPLKFTDCQLEGIEWEAQIPQINFNPFTCESLEESRHFGAQCVFTRSRVCRLIQCFGPVKGLLTLLKYCWEKALIVDLPSGQEVVTARDLIKTALETVVEQNGGQHSEQLLEKFDHCVAIRRRLENVLDAWKQMESDLKDEEVGFQSFPEALVEYTHGEPRARSNDSPLVLIPHPKSCLGGFEKALELRPDVQKPQADVRLQSNTELPIGTGNGATDQPNSNLHTELFSCNANSGVQVERSKEQNRSSQSVSSKSTGHGTTSHSPPSNNQISFSNPSMSPSVSQTHSKVGSDSFDQKFLDFNLSAPAGDSQSDPKPDLNVGVDSQEQVNVAPHNDAGEKLGSSARDTKSITHTHTQMKSLGNGPETSNEYFPSSSQQRTQPRNGGVLRRNSRFPTIVNAPLAWPSGGASGFTEYLSPVTNYVADGLRSSKRRKRLSKRRKRLSKRRHSFERFSQRFSKFKIRNSKFSTRVLPSSCPTQRVHAQPVQGAGKTGSTILGKALDHDAVLRAILKKISTNSGSLKNTNNLATQSKRLGNQSSSSISARWQMQNTNAVPYATQAYIPPPTSTNSESCGSGSDQKPGQAAHDKKLRQLTILI
eukprot:Gregarina_sp_Poly_1__5168@NODE_273_length_10223_cov_99_622391_g238_i0_p2_GENE_NODE_273_length_10223_cov_99_622391_g238_i0NODE_273_length_10223_cov_99_622391_g238_i0_p2_ORF_typecomplete_len666_score64_48Sipho_Gp157/PF05565_11/0_49Sipho_Gp157/PF05565_11/1_2e02DUF2130/PF09903_9/0_23DUF2130/PF09903_9/9_1e02DUF2130/PF09903_9/6_7e02PTCBBRCT/PF12738_7/0_31_NODE_273_length_10223_cov_99_622391_g238_i021914188